jgi:hypothetical protein
LFLSFFKKTTEKGKKKKKKSVVCVLCRVDHAMVDSSRQSQASVSLDDISLGLESSPQSAADLVPAIQTAHTATDTVQTPFGLFVSAYGRLCSCLVRADF